MHDLMNHLTALHELTEGIEPASPLLRRCLEFQPTLEPWAGSATAQIFGGRTAELEEMKTLRPKAAASLATVDLQGALSVAQSTPTHENLLAFCSALSTWGSMHRNLNQRGDAALALEHCLRILEPVPVCSQVGFALQRASYVIADAGVLGDAEKIEQGWAAVAGAIEIHRATQDGEANIVLAIVSAALFRLFYERKIQEARDLLMKVDMEDFVFATDFVRGSALHAFVYSFLMEEKFDMALVGVGMLSIVQKLLPQSINLRLLWLQAEVSATLGYEKTGLYFERLFSLSRELAEPECTVLACFDTLRYLASKGSPSEELGKWHERLFLLRAELDPARTAALEPLFEALDQQQLDSELLDSTVVAFKKAVNPMFLGMGRPGGAGKPETLGRLEAV